MYRSLISDYGSVFERDYYRKNANPKVEEIKTEKLVAAIITAYPFLEEECRARLSAVRAAARPPESSPPIPAGQPRT